MEPPSEFTSAGDAGTSCLAPKVTIVMCCRNEAQHIEPVLQSVLSQQGIQGGFEVVIADGMSEDGTRDIVGQLAEKDGRIRLIDNPGRIASTGLNSAIAVAKGTVIVRMDAHTEYAADYVRCCLEVQEQTKADNVGGPARTKASRYLEKAIAAAYHSVFSVGGAKFHNPNYEGPVDTVTYGCWRREAFERFGYFDEELARNQDDEHNLRITRGGGRIWQSPRIKSWYRPRRSLPALFRQYMQYGYWKVRVILKHGLPASMRHLVPVASGIVLFALALASLFSSVAACASVLLLTLYTLAVTAASISTAWKAGWSLLPVLPLVFLCYHLGYGYGFLRAALECVVLRRHCSKSSTQPTRGTPGI